MAGELVGEILVKNKFLTSKSEWRRLVLEGAVHDLMGNKNIQDQNLKISKKLLARTSSCRKISC